MNELKELEKSIMNDSEREVTSSIFDPKSKVDETEDEPKIVLELAIVEDDQKSKKICENERILLKHLLSVPAATSTETTKTATTSEEMITRTEVTNEELKLRKIIYQTDSDEKKSATAEIESIFISDNSHVDEDEEKRLVIAISDDEVVSEVLTKTKKNVSDGRKTTSSSLKLLTKETQQQGEIHIYIMFIQVLNFSRLLVYVLKFNETIDEIFQYKQKEMFRHR